MDLDAVVINIEREEVGYCAAVKVATDESCRRTSPTGSSSLRSQPDLEASLAILFILLKISHRKDESKLQKLYDFHFISSFNKKYLFPIFKKSKNIFLKIIYI